MVPVERPADAGDALVLVDATSGAGGLPLDPRQADAYYFAPQKGFGSDGGLWLALLSPAAIARIAELDGADGPLAAGVPVAGDARSRTRARTRPTTRRRSRPCCCSPTRSTGCSTRAASTGASALAARRRATSTAGPRRRELATPFVADPAKRSPVVGTIDFDEARRRRGAGRDPARERDRRHRALPQARAATSCGSGCSRRSTPPTSRRSPPASTGSSRTPPEVRPMSADRTLTDAVPRVLVKEKIADAGVDLLRAEFDVELGLDWDQRRARAPDRRVRRDPDPLGDQDDPGADRARRAPEGDRPRRHRRRQRRHATAATKRGIIVANAPESNSVAAAEHTLALALALCRNVPAGARLAGRRRVGALALRRQRALRQDARRDRLRPHRPARRPARPGVRHGGGRASTSSSPRSASASSASRASRRARSSTRAPT